MVLMLARWPPHTTQKRRRAQRQPQVTIYGCPTSNAMHSNDHTAQMHLKIYRCVIELYAVMQLPLSRDKRQVF